MDVRRVGTWSAFGCSLSAGAAFVIWPDKLWIAKAIFAAGFIIIAIAWGWYGLSRMRLPLPWIGWQVPFQDAARLVYEAMERTGIDAMTEPGYSSPIVPLDHAKHIILSVAKRGLITLFGAREPSRQTLPIPSDLISQLEPARNNANGVNSLSRASPIDFYNVWLSRRDVRRVIASRIALIEGANRDLAG